MIEIYTTIAIISWAMGFFILLFMACEAMVKYGFDQRSAQLLFLAIFVTPFIGALWIIVLPAVLAYGIWRLVRMAFMGR